MFETLCHFVPLMDSLVDDESILFKEGLIEEYAIRLSDSTKIQRRLYAENLYSLAGIFDSGG